MRIRVVLLPLLAALACAAPATPAAAGPADVAEKFSEVAQRDVAAATDPGRYDAAVDAFEASGEHDTLLFQHALAGDLGMTDAPWAGTHNSFNSIAEMGPALSANDSNQQLTLVDQLRLGVRSLELDLHLWLGRPTVCHAQSRHEGCTTERTLDSLLAPVADWLRAHPREVVLLYAEDHLDTAAGFDAGAAVLRERLGSLLYAPAGPGCTQLPGTLTRNEVLRAGAQVVVVSDCGPGAWSSVAFAWDEHRESRPQAFAGFPGCGPDFTRAEYDERLIRYYEDSTFLTSAASEVQYTSRDDGLTPETTAAMARCGVELLGFDQLVPGDGRLEALVWSWADGVPATAATCAMARGDDARWTTAACLRPRPAACRTAAGAWRVTRAVPMPAAAGACRRLGAALAAPRTARENALLAEAARGRDVLLGLRRTAAGWRASDAR